MGITHRVAKGPNPLSIKRRVKVKVIEKAPKKKKRRLRNGKRSKALSKIKATQATV